MEQYFTEEVSRKFEIMYEGDKSRDASPSIRGFLFQDLLAIEYLLEDKVQSVWIESLEDVDVAYEDGDFKIVQAKYYPQTAPVMKEITTDLYYQYLRFRLLDHETEAHKKIKVKPQLVIHRTETVAKPDYKKMKEYVGTVSSHPPDVPVDIEEQLRTKTDKKTKEEQKQAVFTSWADEQSLSDFLEAFKIVKKDHLQRLREEIEAKLDARFPLHTGEGVRKHRGMILLGLAILFVQRRYKSDKTGWNDIQIKKTDFENHINSHMEAYHDQSIVAYISAIATGEYENIILGNEALSEEQTLLLNTICRYTIVWIEECFGDADGQFRIVNTLSSDTCELVENFRDQDAFGRLVEIAGCRENLKSFFKYLWKIMFDICSKHEGFDPVKDGELLRPQKYIVESETEYLCLRFPQDCVNTSVILPPAYDFQERKNCFWLRLMNKKPQKWFMKCDSSLAGKHEYAYNTANIVEDDSVVDLGRDSFVIECMQCVKTDLGEWTQIDNCEACIFAETCVKRGR